MERSRLLKGSSDNEIYTNIIRPELEAIKTTYGGTSNVVFSKFLKAFCEENDLNTACEVSNFPFKGQIVNPHCWSCVTKIDPERRSNKVSYYPQLFISIRNDLLTYGFSYGVNLQDNSKYVESVASDTEIAREAFQAFDLTHLRAWDRSEEQSGEAYTPLDHHFESVDALMEE